jgi:hypothetical protein
LGFYRTKRLSQFNINVKGAVFLIKHAIPVIPDGGAVILAASVAGAGGGLGGSTIYGSTRAALRSFGRAIERRKPLLDQAPLAILVAPALWLQLNPLGPGEMIGNARFWNSGRGRLAVTRRLVPP